MEHFRCVPGDCLCKDGTVRTVTGTIRYLVTTGEPLSLKARMISLLARSALPWSWSAQRASMDRNELYFFSVFGK